MAHKKGQGSTRNGRDSNAQRLGVKSFGSELITAGTIIIRQRGTKFHAGQNVGTGRDCRGGAPPAPARRMRSKLSANAK